MERLVPFNGPSIRLDEDQTVALNMLAQDGYDPIWIAEQDAIGNLVVKAERDGSTHTYKVNTIGEISPKEVQHVGG